MGTSTLGTDTDTTQKWQTPRVWPHKKIERSSSCRLGSAHLTITTGYICVAPQHFACRPYEPTGDDTASRLCLNCPVSPCVLIPNDSDPTFQYFSFIVKILRELTNISINNFTNTFTLRGQEQLLVSTGYNVL